MAKIVDVSIRWNFEWANDPTLQLQFDEDVYEIIKRMKYDKYGDDCWMAVEDEYVSFMSHPGNGEKMEGYGGARYTLNMKDGTRKDLVGPWSGNASWASAMSGIPVVDASVTNSPEVMERGYTFNSGAATLGGAERILLEKLPDVVMIPVIWHINSADIWYVPFLLNNPCLHKEHFEATNRGNDRCPSCHHKVYTLLPSGLYISTKTYNKEINMTHEELRRVPKNLSGAQAMVVDL